LINTSTRSLFNMKKTLPSILGSPALAFLGLLFTASAMAQDQQTSPFLFTVEGGGVHQTEVDLSDSSGGFAVDRAFFGTSVDFGWSMRDSIGISVGGGKSSYEFNDKSLFGGGDPWGKVEDARISLTWRSGFSDNGSFFLIPTMRFDGESGTSDDTTYGLYTAAAWRLSDALTIGPGLGMMSRLEDSTRFFPILAIDWDITGRWNLSTGSGLAASRGPGLTLNYRLNDDWSLGVSGRYEDVEFRLDDKGPHPDGVGRDLSLPLVFLATLKPNPKLTFSVFTGVELFGTLKLKDPTGKVVEESDYDPAPVFGATFRIQL
jgi:hypothetical protein